MNKILLPILSIILSSTLYAEELEEYVQHHFDQIYQQINALNYQSNIVLDLKSEIDGLQSENRILRDQLEQLKQKIIKLEKSFVSNRHSIPDSINPEQGLKLLSTNSSPDSELKALAQAKVLLRNKANDQAIALLEPLTFSTSQELALESQYWLGVSYVTKKECERARPYLTNFYNTAPNHDFAPEAILANAICERESGNQTEYQAAIKLLKNQYPESRAAKSLP